MSKDVMEMLTLMNKTKQTTTLLVTHEAQAANYCDRVILIRDGKLYTEIHHGYSRQVFFKK